MTAYLALPMNFGFLELFGQQLAICCELQVVLFAVINFIVSVEREIFRDNTS